MLEALLGSQDEERALMYLNCREEGYPRQMARETGATFSSLQTQLRRLEEAGILYSERFGRTRVYRFNPRYPFLGELRALLTKALRFYPEAERELLLMSRQRPRLAGKPL
jgi:DNA-binding MarR family transcriptional regulator